MNALTTCSPEIRPLKGDAPPCVIACAFDIELMPLPPPIALAPATHTAISLLMPIRILATGFSSFPGAPVNPTEVLIGMLGSAPPDLGADVVLESAVMPVEYGRVPAMLAGIGRRFRPDIAIHFGLAQTARGFRLERQGRNRNSVIAPDAAGALPPARAVGPGPARIAATLPLEAIAAALVGQGLPVQWSDNAGAYLCNFTLYSVCAGLVDGFRPPLAGFVHVPFLDEQLAVLPKNRAARLPSLTHAQLAAGATAILATSVAAFRAAGAARALPQDNPG